LKLYDPFVVLTVQEGGLLRREWADGRQAQTCLLPARSFLSGNADSSIKVARRSSRAVVSVVFAHTLATLDKVSRRSLDYAVCESTVDAALRARHFSERDEEEIF
jgi:hypothetical protein